MKPRWGLMVLTAMLLLVGVGVWWMLDGRSRSTQSIPAAAAPAPTPSEPAHLDAPEPSASEPTSSKPISREKIQPAAPTPAKAKSAGVRRTQGTFSGRVTSAADKADIIGAYVHLERIGASEPMDPPIADYSDWSGKYAIYGAPEGDWMLVCSAASHAKAEVRVSMTFSGGEKQQDFRLQPDPRRNVVLHLTAPGGRSLFDHLEPGDAALVDLLRPVFLEQCPRRGADLAASVSTMPFQGRAVDHAHAVTDEWQHVMLRSDGGGCCAVLLGDRVLDAAAYTPGSGDLTLVVSMEDLHGATGSLRLAVVHAATNKPIPGVSVSLQPAAGPNRVTTTDASGRAEFTLVMPGEAVCEVDAYATRNLTIQSGNSTDLGTIQLPATFVVSGTIDLPASATGGGRTAVTVYAHRIADEDGPATESSVQSHTDGAFEFPRLYPGEYVIGWQHRTSPPDPEAVRHGNIPGWVFVDARTGAVNSVHIP